MCAVQTVLAEPPPFEAPAGLAGISLWTSHSVAQLPRPPPALRSNMAWNVAAAHRPPYVIVNKARSPPTFTGILVDLLPLLFMEAGFNTTASS